MAQRTQLDDANNPLHEAYACLLANGLDGAGVAPRVDYANGYKSKTVLTRLDEVTFEVPQVRSGGFCPSALAARRCSMRAFRPGAPAPWMTHPM